MRYFKIVNTIILPSDLELKGNVFCLNDNQINGDYSIYEPSNPLKSEYKGIDIAIELYLKNNSIKEITQEIYDKEVSISLITDFINNSFFKDLSRQEIDTIKNYLNNFTENKPTNKFNYTTKFNIINFFKQLFFKA